MVPKRARLKDVAEKAGVAVNTASTILNRKPNSWASKETEERVFKAARELNYRPNRAAKSLQAGKFNAVGLLIADINNPYFTNFAEMMAIDLEQKGYNLVIESWRTDVDREVKQMKDLVDRTVDGVVAFVSDVEIHRDFLEYQAKAGYPIVIMAMPGAKDIPVDAVMPDFETGLEEAAKVLMQQGHKNVAFLAARSKGQRVGGRPAIFERIFQQLLGSKPTVVECGATIEDALATAKTLLSSDSRPSAVIALNDFSAIGVMRAAKELGLSVPGDLSVVGIDGVPLAAHLPVSLSTIVMPHLDMVQQASKFLHERIIGEAGEAVRHAKFPTHFLQRESSAKAPAQGQ
ncbi:MAG: LacI family DNA-binding transcriptional regulator [Akkermansiaceae bacterium]|nr:LacI family DNA-binding transcriptional regulator [Akkermansiaceae bacterium]